MPKRIMNNVLVEASVTDNNDNVGEKLPALKKAKTSCNTLYSELAKLLDTHIGEAWTEKALSSVDLNAEQMQNRELRLNEQILPFKLALNGATSLIKKQKNYSQNLIKKNSVLIERVRKLRRRLTTTAETASSNVVSSSSQKSTHNTAKIGAVALRFDSIFCVRPRGKFNINVYSTLVELNSNSVSNSSTSSFLLSSISNIISVTMPITKERILVLPLTQKLIIGKTYHGVIVLKFKQNDKFDSKVAIAPLHRSSLSDLTTIVKDNSAFEASAKLFGIAAQKKVETTSFDVFRSATGKNYVTCHYKAQHGAMFFLKSGILFALKPVIFIAKNHIRKIEFNTQTRYFELVVTIHTHEKFGFEMMEIDEHGPVSDFLHERKFVSAARTASGSIDENDDEDDDEDDDDNNDDNNDDDDDDDETNEDNDEDVGESLEKALLTSQRTKAMISSETLLTNFDVDEDDSDDPEDEDFVPNDDDDDDEADDDDDGDKSRDGEDDAITYDRQSDGESTSDAEDDDDGQFAVVTMKDEDDTDDNS